MDAGMLSALTEPWEALRAIALAERIAENAPLAVKARSLVARGHGHWKTSLGNADPLAAEGLHPNDAGKAQGVCRKARPNWTGTQGSEG